MKTTIHQTARARPPTLPIWPAASSRQENLRNTLRMIDNRFNSLAHWDNPTGDRYSVELEIISVEMAIDAKNGNGVFPLIEILKPNIVDKKASKRIDGIAGNNFSSYVRDYDFSVVLPNTTSIDRSSAHPMILATCTASCSSTF